MSYAILWGYIDPGSGTLLVQAVIASVAACLVFARRMPLALLARCRRGLVGRQNRS